MNKLDAIDRWNALCDKPADMILRTEDAAVFLRSGETLDEEFPWHCIDRETGCLVSLTEHEACQYAVTNCVAAEDPYVSVVYDGETYSGSVEGARRTVQAATEWPMPELKALAEYFELEWSDYETPDDVWSDICDLTGWFW